MEVKPHLRNIMEFLCERKPLPLDKVMESCLFLINHCPSARDATLRLYYMVLREHFNNTVLNELPSTVPGTNDGSRIPGFTPSPLEVQAAIESIFPPSESLLVRFATASAEAANQPPMDIVEERLRKSSTDSEEMKHSTSETPRSPPMLGSNSEVQEPDQLQERQLMDICSDLEPHIISMGDSLLDFISRDPKSALSKQILEWALETLAQLSQDGEKLYNFSMQQRDLSEVIETYSKNTTMAIMLQIIIKSDAKTTDNYGRERMLSYILKHSPSTDWLFAHLASNLSSTPSVASDTQVTPNSFFADCIQFLVKASDTNVSPASVTRILSFLSERNPKAIINCNKSNVPFLLKLCYSSTPLLNVLASEIPKQVNIDVLNELAESPEMDATMEMYIIHCMLNAPNAFDLLLMAFDVCVEKQASSVLLRRAHIVLEAILKSLHEAVYSTPSLTSPKISALLQGNVSDLVRHAISRSNASMRKLHINLLHLLCVHFGIEYANRVIFSILNLAPPPPPPPLAPQSSSKQGSTSCPPPSCHHPVQSLLQPLLKMLRLRFGAKVKECIGNTLQLDEKKSKNFWENLLSLVDTDEFIDIDLDLLTDYYIHTGDKSAPTNEKFQINYLILKLIESCLTRRPKAFARPKHRLCTTLAVNYFVYVDALRDADDALEDILLKSIIVSQNCMASLARSFPANQHILCRTLLELSLKNNKLFSPITSRLVIVDQDTLGSLIAENRQLDSAHSLKLRKAALIPKSDLQGGKQGKVHNSNHLLNRQMAVDAFKSSIVEMSAFAALVVECVTPDVMFNDDMWPDEDFLKVTIERDLHIARQFDLNPLLWDLSTLIAEAGLLSSCAVMTRALMAVQLTQWAAATANKDKLDSTHKLITLLIRGGLLPAESFQHIPKVLSQLQPWEIFCVLNDLWRYLKDSSAARSPSAPVKQYLERLRVIMAQNLPGPLFVKIFKPLQPLNSM